MKIIDMTCPHCGANLKIDGEKTVAYCEHCVTVLFWIIFFAIGLSQ